LSLRFLARTEARDRTPAAALLDLGMKVKPASLWRAQPSVGRVIAPRV